MFHRGLGWGICHHQRRGSFDLRQQQYTAEQAEQFITTLRDQASVLPGVRAVSTTMVEPLHQQCGTMVSVIDNASDPAANASYSPLPRAGRLNINGQTRVVLEGGPPNGRVDIVVWTVN